MSERSSLLDTLVETILQRCSAVNRTVGLCFIDLDQYTLRRFFRAPFIGLANYLEAFAAAVESGRLTARTGL